MKRGLPCTVLGFLVAGLVASCSSSVASGTPASPSDGGADALLGVPAPDAPSPVDASREDASREDAPSFFDRGAEPHPDADARDAPTRDAPTSPVDARDARPDSGVPVPPPGPAVCSGATCAPGEVCCYATGRCHDPGSPEACAVPPRTADPRACASNAHCAAGEYCEFEAGPGRCIGIGTCQARRGPELCGGFGAGVCGCDGRTWPTPCAASLAGVRVAAMVPCGTRLYPDPNFRQLCDPAAGCRAGWTCDPGLRECLPARFVVACGTNAECPAGQACCQHAGVCLGAADAELCRPLPQDATLPCRTDADCEPLASPFGSGRSEFYCAGPGCAGPGGCVRRARGCPGELMPVCGCDRRAYTSPCTAGAEGVRIAHAGTCP